MTFDDGPAYTHFSCLKPSKKCHSLISVDEQFYAKILGEMVEVVFCPKSKSKHKTRCFSQVKHRKDSKHKSEAMIFDNGPASTHFSYAKSSNNAVFSFLDLFRTVLNYFWSVFDHFQTVFCNFHIVFDRLRTVFLFFRHLRSRGVVCKKNWQKLKTIKII